MKLISLVFVGVLILGMMTLADARTVCKTHTNPSGSDGSVLDCFDDSGAVS
jgi:hypothetical protein